VISFSIEGTKKAYRKAMLVSQDENAYVQEERSKSLDVVKRIEEYLPKVQLGIQNLSSAYPNISREFKEIKIKDDAIDDNRAELFSSALSTSLLIQRNPFPTPPLAEAHTPTGESSIKDDLPPPPSHMPPPPPPPAPEVDKKKITHRLNPDLLKHNEQFKKALDVLKGKLDSLAPKDQTDDQKDTPPDAPSIQDLIQHCPIEFQNLTLNHTPDETPKVPPPPPPPPPVRKHKTRNKVIDPRIDKNLIVYKAALKNALVDLQNQIALFANKKKERDAKEQTKQSLVEEKKVELKPINLITQNRNTTPQPPSTQEEFANALKNLKSGTSFNPNILKKKDSNHPPSTKPSTRYVSMQERIRKAREERKAKEAHEKDDSLITQSILLTSPTLIKSSLPLNVVSVLTTNTRFGHRALVMQKSFEVENEDQP
jgi:hypothetical protein